jgi:uncharacterized protein YkwD
MGWASRHTDEMPVVRGGPTAPDGRITPVRSASPGRHRRRRARRFGLIGAALLLALAVAGAMLSPTLLGWPPPAHGTATGPSTVATTAARSTAPRTPSRTTAPATGAAATGIEAFENRVLELTNERRAEQGCTPLRLDQRLQAAARGHSRDMARHGYFSHTGRDGSGPGQRLVAAGYRTDRGWAENIAAGYPSPAAVMAGWMGSPGHRANILNCGHRALGVGVARGSEGRLYWTQDFGGR